MFRFLLNPYVLLAIGIGSVVIIGGTYLKGFSDGKNSEISRTNKEKLETIDENIEIKKLQERVVRPSDRSLVDSLRKGTF